MGQVIWSLLLGRLLLMLPLPIISVSSPPLSCRAVALAGGGGAVDQSQPVETDPSPT